MRLLISDANILIDMEAGALLETLFRLPMQFGIPDLLYYEEIEPGSPGLETMGLHIMEVSGDFVKYAENLPRQYNHLPDRRRQSSGRCQPGTHHGHGHDWTAARHGREPAPGRERCLQGARQNEAA